MKKNEHAYIIAEVGNTHEGSLGLAKKFIDSAAKCGVDAVKFQTHLFEAESLLDAPNPPYFKGESRREYFERTAFSEAQWRELKLYAGECGVDFLSSPFSIEAVDLLERIDVAAFKIPSGEVTNIPLLIAVAATGKPVLLSSGMSTWAELDKAVDSLTSNNCGALTVLQCASEYPCPPASAGLNVLDELRQRYDLPVGYSDHTLGVGVAIAAVALGATVVEKHFTLSRDMYGSDAAHATDPSDFKLLVDALRDAEAALCTNVDKDSKAATLGDMKAIFEKSIVAARDLEQSHVMAFEDLAFKKPGVGISAAKYDEVLGKRLKVDVPGDHQFSMDDFDE